MTRRIHRACAAACLAAIAAACGSPPTTPPPVSDGPVVHSITPNAGATTGGTGVTIRGLRFAPGATVTIGGQPATDVIVESAEALTARTPASLGAGPAAVVVSVNGRSSSLAGGFTFLVAPVNALPVITSITARGNRPREPENFADVREIIAVSATVTDPETSADQLEYNWSATAGTFSGTGASVTWEAPATADSTPAQVTITLRLVERFGNGGIFQHEVTGTRVVALHDSAREIGGMAVRFLEEFSKPQTNRDWQDVMRDFSASLCPDPRTVESERDDVLAHIQNFHMNAFTIAPAAVSVDFGAGCVFIGNRFRPGDACVSVRTNWDSTDQRSGIRANTIGTDYLSAVYSSIGSRWWLCSSDFEPTGALGHRAYSMR